jgi:hypothetical protein
MFSGDLGQEKPRFALYIGRWQNWHPGHRWLIDQQLDKGKKVWIAIRDTEKDENNPKTAQKILAELNTQLRELILAGKVLISIIPDVESVNYGRGVGYEIVFHEPPTEIASHSGTTIRAKLTNQAKESDQ